MSVALTKWIHVEMWKVFLATLPSDKIIMGNTVCLFVFFLSRMSEARRCLHSCCLACILALQTERLLNPVGDLSHVAM